MDTSDNATKIAQDIKKALGFLELGNPFDAEKVFTDGFMYNLESQEIDITEVYCKYWIERMNTLAMLKSPYERGERLFVEWKSFLRYVSTKAMRFDDAINAIKAGVFSIALRNYITLLPTSSGPFRAQILLKLGICYKKRGLFVESAGCLVEANSLTPNTAAIIAQLADCYALCGYDKDAKVLFREAFYIGARDIELDFLDSLLIRDLITKVTDVKGITPALNDWIAVYGVVLGVLNIKRLLNSKEISKLRQEIYALENSQKDPARYSADSVPRLINMYFRLIDYCRDQHDEKTISESLLKIKILDKDIYTAYVG